MSISLRRLSPQIVDGSPELNSWVNQFSDDKRVTAIRILLQLRFVSRDMYSEWLKSELLKLPAKPSALYAVRKFEKETELWDGSGKVLNRPASSLGSEDLVQSIVASMIKYDQNRFLDNPDLDSLKKIRVRNVVLIDDSIGSGERVASFIQMMMKSKTFLSWWSFGWIHLYILAFSRTNEAANRIVKSISGSDHHKRKYRKSTKIHFISHLVYQRTNLKNRWGTNYQAVLDLCSTQKVIPAHARLGYGETMANIVFYHSIPDNIPGMLWFNEGNRWIPLFPNRTMPAWFPPLLDSISHSEAQEERRKISKSLLAILKLIKNGIKSESSLAFALGLDVIILREMLSQGRDSGFLTESNQLTETGMRIVFSEKNKSSAPFFDRSLYVPKGWCVGQGTIQPSGREERNLFSQADPTDD